MCKHMHINPYMPTDRMPAPHSDPHKPANPETDRQRLPYTDSFPQREIDWGQFTHVK